MMKSLRKLQTKRAIMVLALLLLACKPDKSIYYYSCFDEDQNLIHYMLKQIEEDNNIRKEKDFVLHFNGKKEMIDSNTFEVFDEEVFKVTSVQKPYLTVQNKNCIVYKYENELADFAETKLCYLGLEDLNLNGRFFTDVYKFLKIKGGGVDNVESIVFFDKKFLLLKEEFVSGYGSYYKIERLDTIIELNNSMK